MNNPNNENKKKKKQYRKPAERECFYCGSKKIEQIYAGGVSITRCKDCGETLD